MEEKSRFINRLWGLLFSGVLVVVTPLLGLPNSIQTGVSVLAGLIVVGLSFAELRSAHRALGLPERRSEERVESKEIHEAL